MSITSLWSIFEPLIWLLNLLKKVCLLIFNSFKYKIWWRLTNKRIAIKISQNVIFDCSLKPLEKKEKFMILDELKKKSPTLSFRDLQINNEQMILKVKNGVVSYFPIKLLLIDESILKKDVFGEEFEGEETLVLFETPEEIEIGYSQDEKLEAFFEVTTILIDYLRREKFDNKEPRSNYTIISAKPLVKIEKGMKKRKEDGECVLTVKENLITLKFLQTKPHKIIKQVKVFFAPYI